ncbi:MAG: hypothetical protein AMJ95_13195 [Omnitrophica WOR_2 bacterium SM23_72]|nr:MAG: hypothetical protein AMJ95_13195 [Omnitrophica WOR_2 bacterium SM23_72]
MLKEEVWDTKVVADTAGRGKCIRRFAQNVKKSAKSRLNPETIVRYTARTVIQSVRTKAAKSLARNKPLTLGRIVLY